ncbi:MAG: hypothetical protein IKO40_06640, partial [Kiritimatiellae bacterium]|nr:hypothetical protein [Kiritimatiellia bacterium]
LQPGDEARTVVLCAPPAHRAKQAAGARCKAPGQGEAFRDSGAGSGEPPPPNPAAKPGSRIPPPIPNPEIRIPPLFQPSTLIL